MILKVDESIVKGHKEKGGGWRWHMESGARRAHAIQCNYIGGFVVHQCRFVESLLGVMFLLGLFWFM